jgi:hypothetical protein
MVGPPSDGAVAGRKVAHVVPRAVGHPQAASVPAAFLLSAVPRASRSFRPPEAAIPVFIGILDAPVTAEGDA